MNLYIVVAVFNRKKYTIELFELLKKQTYQAYKVVLVDDGSTDGTYEDVSRLFPEIEIVKGPGDWWWTKSTNEGIKKALQLGADKILVMNNDTFLEDNYLQTILNISDQNPGAIIGSLDVTYEEPRKVFYAGIKKLIWWKSKGINYINGYVLYDKEKFTGLHPTPCLNGRGSLFPKEVFDKIGFLDEKKLPQYASDFDITIRAVKAGIPCYMSWDAVVYAYVGLTGAGKAYISTSYWQYLKSFFGKYSQTSLSTMFAYYWKHCTWYEFITAIPIHIIKLNVSYFKRRNAFKN
jgi:GT2 family glycosyltransferase